MEKIKIGKIVNAVGLKGEIKVFSYSGAAERYGRLDGVYIDGVKHEIEKVRSLRNVVILKVSGIDDRTAAEGAKGQDICIDEADLPKLPEGEYYVRDMIGHEVADESGNVIGVLCDVIQNSAQDLYEVEMADGRKVMIPAVDEFVLSIDMEKKRITVRLIEGLI